MKRAVVIIPIHKAQLDEFELISLRRAKNIFNKHDLVIVCPKSVGKVDYLGIEKIILNNFWFKNLFRYNKLKKSKFFYNLFSNFQYILTYELDAFAFRDELDMWCSKGYDYIGAPWYEGFTQADPSSKIIGVGNSGFSLRKVSLKDKINEYIQPPKIFYSRNLILKITGLVIVLIFKLLKKVNLNNSVFLFNDDPEDIFYGYRLSEKGIQVNIAPVEEATKFSFEINPRELFKLNDNALPFGCHAWWKYDLDFWKKYINNDN